MITYIDNDTLYKLEKIYIQNQNKKFNYIKEKYWLNFKKLLKTNFFNKKYQNFLYINKDICLHNYDYFFIKKIIKDKINNLILMKNAIYLYFINGLLYKDISDITNNYYNITINELNCDRDFCNSFYQKNIYVYLSYILSQKLISINITDISNNTNNINKPIYFIYLNINNTNNMQISNYYNNITLNNKNIIIIEHFINLNQNCFNNTYTNYFCKNNTILKHYLFITDHCNKISTYCSNYTYHLYNTIQMKKYDLLSNYKNIHYNNYFKFIGNNSTLKYKSLILTTKNSIINNYNYLKHNSKNCYSFQLHKSIALKNSIINLISKLYINKIAKKTDGQINYNSLILDQNSEINMQPKLDIYNNNVKCKHSALTGKIDKTQIFFLRTRGIKLRKIFAMLIYAFIIDTINDINDINIKEIISQYTSYYYLLIENYI
ncbi:SufD family Fe-S cluster assembly protein [Enterobacteriaceae endosymbiont of Neohaemonia nigricornis]|uniref:SufD family Fe-S cluster assembly protein n=1 Tax=Enterobacteriaceae endosymbiont of Neohaemonia nigricornis TaxID=2675792 RepID=UPI001ABFAEC7|nr:SufD family Fe-S cluster assembly protein [Enterobacteriaceae endosymbiont of Neohaemonia nigricornis]